MTSCRPTAPPRPARRHTAASGFPGSGHSRGAGDRDLRASRPELSGEFRLLTGVRRELSITPRVRRGAYRDGCLDSAWRLVDC